MTYFRVLFALLVLALGATQAQAQPAKTSVWLSPESSTKPVLIAVQDGQNVIQGRITSIAFPGPLDSQSWYETRVVVSKIYPNDPIPRILFSTDCWDTYQGCVFGNSYRFDSGYSNMTGEYGPLDPGDYKVVVFARGHKGGVQATNYVTLPTSSSVDFRLNVVDTYGEIVDLGQNTIPSSGGTMSVLLRLYNYGSPSGQAAVTTIYQGPGLTTENLTYDVSRNVVSLSEEGSYYDITVDMFVEAEVPDGTICGYVVTGHPTKPKEEYSREYFCGTKGGSLTGGGGSEGGYTGPEMTTNKGGGVIKK